MAGYFDCNGATQGELLCKDRNQSLTCFSAHLQSPASVQKNWYYPNPVQCCENPRCPQRGRKLTLPITTQSLSNTHASLYIPSYTHQ